MKKKFLLYAILVTILLVTSVSMVSSSNSPLYKAESLVSEFYSNLQRLSSQDANKSFVRDDLLSNYIFEEDGIILARVPNEFKHIGYETMDDGESDINAGSYISYFDNMFAQPLFCDMKFEYNMIPSKAKTYRAPDFVKDEIAYADFTVSKRYVKGYHSTSFNDTIRVNIGSNRIVRWTNEASHKRISISVEMLKSQAAEAYENKDFKEAYRVYTQVIGKNETDGEAYYRMAVMLHDKYKKLGVDKKERDRLIFDYLHKALRYGDYDISNKASNMLYWIEC